MSITLTALITDDSGVMRKMVMKSLTESKLATFEFVEAVDGVDALSKLEEHDIDIAFVDWNMPNMTGIDFVKECRNQERINCYEPIPMVMVTSEKTIGKIQEALDEAGADAFISKPFTVEELQKKLPKQVEKATLLRVRKNRELNAEADAAAESEQSGGWFGKVFG